MHLIVIAFPRLRACRLTDEDPAVDAFVYGHVCSRVTCAHTRPVVLRFDGTTARHHSGHHSSPYLVALMAPRVWLFMFSPFTCFLLYPQRLTYSHVYLYLLAQHTCALNHGSSDSRQRIAQKPRHSRRRGAEKVVVGEDYPRYLLRQ